MKCGIAGVSEPDILDERLKFWHYDMMCGLFFGIFIDKEEMLTDRYGEPKPIGEGMDVNTI